MTCRHSPGDPSCSSSAAYQARERERIREVSRSAAQEEISRLRTLLEQQTVDARSYEVEEVRRKGPHLAMRVRYPSCKACSYEGVKVMVFLNVTEMEALRWREIDPHFRDDAKRTQTSAPSPAARFPATEVGWLDALAYLESKACGA